MRDVLEHLVLPPKQDRVRVMSYNICGGTGADDNNMFLKRETSFVLRNLDAIADLVERYHIDVLCLQEVDLDAYRTNHINEAQYLGEVLGFHWEAHPNHRREPITDLFSFDKKFHLGNAILSRYPITHSKNTRFTEDTPVLSFLKLITVRDLKMSYQSAILDTPLGTISVVNTHMDTFNRTLRAQQAEILLEHLRCVETEHYLLAGDFNAIPPGSERQKFAKNPFAPNYKNDLTMEHFLRAPELHFAQAIKESEVYYPRHLLTYPSGEPNRIIDYVSISPSLAFCLEDDRQVYTVVDTLISDHRPVITEITPSSKQSSL